MEKEFFLNKVSCEFVVITYDEDCAIVTKELGIEPNRFFNKGDKFTSKHTSRIGYKPYGLWAIQSGLAASEDLNISAQIQYFQELFKDKVEIIEKLRNSYHFESIFSISIETEDAGAGFDLSEFELSFISKIASRYSCTFISKESVS